MVYKKYISQLDDFLKRAASVNIKSISLFPSGQIQEQQLGYAKDQHGNDLTGPGKGPWKKYWTVIGRDKLTGDPLILDTRLPGKVLTAMHGMGKWVPEVISETMDGFFKALSFIKTAKENLSPKEKQKLFSRIASCTEARSIYFWTDRISRFY